MSNKKLTEVELSLLRSYTYGTYSPAGEQLFEKLTNEVDKEFKKLQETRK